MTPRRLPSPDAGLVNPGLGIAVKAKLKHFIAKLSAETCSAYVRAIRLEDLQNRSPDKFTGFVRRSCVSHQLQVRPVQANIGAR